MSERPYIYDFSQEELAEQLRAWGQPAYRGAQIWDGLYKQLWAKPEEFTSLSKELRTMLSEHYRFTHLKPSITLNSSDKQTHKTLFKLPDGNAIETVLMRYDDRDGSQGRRTLCISTQAGCAMGCVFCATGQMGFRRNLSVGEIVEQVLYFARQLKAEGEHVTNVVLMGMGEPFHNYKASLAAIARLNDPKGFGLGSRHFTISTVGLIPAIQRYTKERHQMGLAISLHAADDELRASMLPVNQRYPIKDLIQACREYVEVTGRRITFEWALINDVNDTPEQARKLAALLRGLNCHVNVIPLNPTRGFAGKRSTRERVAEFRQILEAEGISCTVRVRRGIDIQAGCGQLAEAEGHKGQQPIQISN
ncbi:MAG: 23S rRNA (adenine(2503)-C(2))-methyltransferase RlmN [Anaerolineales bacterium]|nr:23S rRNA (adenine(2503)-C(2))-methyltransferase RlmN [Anaerolineales bacterium]